MIFDELKQLKATPVELRKFGLLVGTVFTLIGLWFWVRQRPVFPWLLGPGLLLIVLGACLPRWLRAVYLVWMSLALVLGFVVSNVLLSLLFFLVITPVGLVARLAGKDFLGRKRDPNCATYWVQRPAELRPKDDYEKQF